MAVENDGLEALKPGTKQVGALDFVSKYRNDLELLKNGKMTIERELADKGLDDKLVNKKLAKLQKSIDRLESEIKKFEERYELD